MTGASNDNRDEVKALLAKANIEIYNALTRVDEMGDYELADARGRAIGTQAFFDFNGSCGKASLGEFDAVVERVAPSKVSPVAFFDFNGSCGSGALGSRGDLGVFTKTVRNALRRSGT